MLLCSTDASLRQHARLLFNQLHWLCAEHFLMHRSWGSVPGTVISAKTNSIMQMQFQLLSERGEWWSGMPAVNGQRSRGGWDVCKGGGGLGHDIISVPYFCTNPCESAEPTQQGCVVTPQTWRTLPSQNSTFVMSCRRKLLPGSDWFAHFYCPTTWLTFEPRRAIVVDHTGHAQKEKRHGDGTSARETNLFPCALEREGGGSGFKPKRHLNNWCALHVRRNMAQWLPSAPPKMQSSSSTRSIFLFN